MITGLEALIIFGDKSKIPQALMSLRNLMISECVFSFY